MDCVYDSVTKRFCSPEPGNMTMLRRFLINFHRLSSILHLSWTVNLTKVNVSVHDRYFKMEDHGILINNRPTYKSLT